MRKYIFKIIVLLLQLALLYRLEGLNQKIDDVSYVVIGSHDSIITEIYRFRGAD